MFDLIGKTIGPYRVVEQVGVGGMATVYKAYQPSMDRYVAIKILPHYLSQDPEFVKRFQREARAIAKLEHAHILPVHDYGEYEGIAYIVMRYVEAGTLKDRMAQGQLPLDEIDRLIEQIGGALDYAHRLGVIHRDIKPGNVLMDAQGDTYLSDFGLARMMEASQQLTGSGVGVGTPAYMSPEQGQGVKVDHRSDIYSLGVILYEMVTGRVPYEAETPMAVMIKHITDPLPLPRTVKPDVPEPIERVILRALAKNPADRFQTAGELVQALAVAVRKVSAAEAQRAPEPQRAVETERPSPTRADVSLVTRVGRLWEQPRGKVALVGGAVAVVLLLGLFLSQLPGRVAIVGPGAATSTSAIAQVSTPTGEATQPSPTPAASLTPVRPTATTIAPTDTASELSIGVGYGMDVFRRAAITSLAIDPGDADTVFAATNGAGIYVSHDGGRTWVPSNQGLGKATTARIVIDPNNPSILYAATLNQGGVYKSTDSGQTWQAINRGINLAPEWGLSAPVAIAPSDSSRLYYSGTTNGLYMSTDGGASWQPRGNGCPQIMDIAVDPIDADHLVIAGMDTSGYSCPSDILPGVHESRDAGQTWMRLTTEDMAGPKNTYWRLSVDPRDFDTMYASSDFAAYESSDGGQTWTQIRFDSCRWLDVNPADGAVYCGQGGQILISRDGGATWDASSVGAGWIGDRVRPFAAAAGDPQTIYAGVESGLVKSTDGGQTWLPVAQLGAARMKLTIDPRDGRRMFLGGMDWPCDTYRSEDGGQTWLPIVTSGNVCRIAIDPVQGILYHQKPPNQLQRSKDNGQTWELFSTDFPFPELEVAIDSQNSQRIWAIGNCGTRPYLSEDGGLTFTKSQSFPQDLCFGTFIRLDSTGQRIYVGGGGNVLRSDNGGRSWLQLAQLGANFTAAALDPSDSNVMYLGTTYRGLLKTITGGQTWFPLSNLPATSINDIAVDPANPQTVYAATDSGAFITLDGGETWSRIQTGLGPNPIVYSVAVDPNDSSKVYAVTPDGVYRLAGVSESAKPLSPQAEQARAFAEPILAAIADRPPDFADDFSAGGPGWDWDERMAGQVEISSGVMRVNGTGGHGIFPPQNQLRSKNFVFEFDVRLLSQPAIMGTFFRQQNSDIHYSSSVHGNNNSWHINEVGEPQQPTVMGFDNVRPVGETNHITIVGVGDRFAVYLNGEPTAYFEDTTFFEAGNLMPTFGSEGGESVPVQGEFDNFKFWNLENVPGLP